MLNKKVIRVKEGSKIPTRTFSKKQENQVVKELKGYTTLNSGATPFQKGDVLAEGSILIEAKTKTTESKSIAIKKEWLDKLTQESLFMGKKYQSLCFNFGPNTENYYIIDRFLMAELQEYLIYKENNNL